MTKDIFTRIKDIEALEHHSFIRDLVFQDYIYKKQLNDINYNLKDYGDYRVITLTPKKQIERDYKKNKNEVKGLQSLQRARRNLLQIFNDNITMGDLILTLTYEKNETDYEKSYEDFKKFIKRLKYKYSFEYVSVQELQDRGAIHYHVMLFSYGDYIPLTESDLWDIWGHAGYNYQGEKVGVSVDDVRADNIDSLAFYFSKYLSDYHKGQTIGKNKRLFNTSRGVKRVKNEKINYRSFDRLIKSNDHVKIIKKTYNKYIIK